jgi:hypothetical protein
VKYARTPVLGSKMFQRQSEKKEKKLCDSERVKGWSREGEGKVHPSAFYILAITSVRLPVDPMIHKGPKVTATLLPVIEPFAAAVVLTKIAIGSSDSRSNSGPWQFPFELRHSGRFEAKHHRQQKKGCSIRHSL